MINRTKSPRTAAAIGAAMEKACASGDLEVAERLFESYRCLFEVSAAKEVAPCSDWAASGAAPSNDTPNHLDN